MGRIARLTGLTSGELLPRAARAVCAVVLVGSLAACGQGIERVKFDGIQFRGSAKAVDRETRDIFDVTVRQVSRSEAGARQAAAYEATKYCIRWFGISTVEWETAPDAEVVPIDNDVLTLRGRCIE